MGRTCSPTPVGLAGNLYGLQAWFQVLSLVIMCWLDTSSGRPWWAQSKCGLDCILTFLNVLGVTCWAVALKVCSFLLNVKCWQGEKHLWAFSLCTPVSVHTGKQSLEHFTFCLVEFYIRALLSCGALYVTQSPSPPQVEQLLPFCFSLLLFSYSLYQMEMSCAKNLGFGTGVSSLLVPLKQHCLLSCSFCLWHLSGGLLCVRQPEKLNVWCCCFLLKLSGLPLLTLPRAFWAISRVIHCDVSVPVLQWRSEGSSRPTLLISPNLSAVRAAVETFILLHQHPSSQWVLSHQHL